MKEAISMKKWTRVVAVLTVGAALAACGNGADGSVVEPETEQETTSEVTANAEETDFQSMMDQAQAQYDAGKLDEAAGTLSLLLKEDLTNEPDIKTEAEELLEEINLAQSEQAKQVAEESSDKAGYQTERQSSVLGEEYLAATGESIEEATDDDLEEWLAAKEANAEAKVEENSTEETETEEQATFASDEAAEDYAFNQAIERLQLNKEGYTAFVDRTDDQWVSIEVRETVEQDGVEWSNMIGMYRYNLETDGIEKLDSITGEYQVVE